MAENELSLGSDGAPEEIALRHLVGGIWRPGAGPTACDTSPAAPDQVLATFSLATSALLDEAVEVARRTWRGWARTPAHERGAVLARAAAGLEREAGTYGRELSREEGKTLAEGVGEVRRAVQTLRFYSAEPDRAVGELFASPRPGEQILVERLPIGVVGVVTPFNFPIAIPAWKIAPALVYGNCVVWKPAGDVPLLAIRLAEALVAAGLPEGVLSLLIGPSVLGQALVEHPGVTAATFTGSTAVGRRLIESCGRLARPIQTDMGGKNAAVVLADADLPAAVDQVVAGAFRSTGQKCTATSRLIVEAPALDDVLELVRQRLATWPVGDPLDPATQMGPLVSSTARDSVAGGVAAAAGQGGRVVAGGTTYAEGPLANGWFYPPTVIHLAEPGGQLWREELFGPVLAVVAADNADHAFDLADDSEFGLSAAVFTNDLRRVCDAMRRLDVGVLHINSETAGADPHVPFGGAKGSGFGPKEQGRAAREFFTHLRTTYVKAL